MSFILAPPTAEELWRKAIALWIEGDPLWVERALLLDEPVPEFARRWLIEALAGRVRRRRGRPRKLSLTEAVNRHFRAMDIEAAYERHLALARLDPGAGGTPTERAIAATAEELGLTESAVSKVVHPRKSPGA